MNDKILDLSNLEGKLLLATPQLRGSCFDHSVIYVCVHNENGAMGLIINNLMDDLTTSDILGQVGVHNSQLEYNFPVHFGGPIDNSKGFILHSDDYSEANTQHVRNNISLTSTLDILEQITNGGGPSKSIIALGYAGWSAGQLEDEIMQGGWFGAEADSDIIFETNNLKKWDESVKRLGIDINHYSHVAGAA